MSSPNESFFRDRDRDEREADSTRRKDNLGTIGAMALGALVGTIIGVAVEAQMKDILGMAAAGALLGLLSTFR